MEPFRSVFFFASIITFYFYCIYGFSYAEATNFGGFSVELIHRDSPKSPFYDPKDTPAQRMVNEFRRSINRVQRFYPESLPQASLLADEGEYLLKFSLGTPPLDMLAIADTASDLIWIQCQPCVSCYKQDGPIFDPKSSSTYSPLSCNSEPCNYLSQHNCSGAPYNICEYKQQYGYQFHSNGNLAADTLTLSSTNGRPVSFSNITIGCGHDNAGAFSGKTSGVVGLGGGPLSLIGQLGSSISSKFSYCLSSQTKNSSKLNFGDNAVVSGQGVVTTPLVSGISDTFYTLSLESITVENVKLSYTAASNESSQGNIIVGSGSALTLVPKDFFSILSSTIDLLIHGKRAHDPYSLLQLCYYADSNFKAPSLTVNFKGGADVKLDPDTTFVEVSKGIVCLTFYPIDLPYGSVFGNLAQSNYLVGFDLEQKVVSFKPIDCTSV